MNPKDFNTHKDWIRYLEEIERSYQEEHGRLDDFDLAGGYDDYLNCPDENGLCYSKYVGAYYSDHTTQPMFAIKKDHFNEEYHNLCDFCLPRGNYGHEHLTPEETFWVELEADQEWHRTQWFNNGLNLHNMRSLLLLDMSPLPPYDPDWIAKTPCP